MAAPITGRARVLFQIDIDYGVDHHQNSGHDHARDEAVAQAA